MIVIKLPVLLLAFTLIACTPFGGFKPPPAGWTYYADGGATKQEIEIVYLECGFPVPGDFRDFSKELLVKLGFDDVDKQYAALAAKYHCMKDAGFPIGKLNDPCQVGYGRSFWPACQPGAVIPKRSVENRLNSSYCNFYPKAKVCQSENTPSSVEKNTLVKQKWMLIAPP